MKKIQTEIAIKATAEKVWLTLLDFERYPEWNPFVLAISGKAEVGERLKVVLKNGKGTSVFQPIVLVAEPNRSLEWLGSLPIPGLFNGHHQFRIEPIDNHKIRFSQSEDFSGLLATLLLKIVGDETRKSFIAMNEALKVRCEAEMKNPEK